MAAMGIECLRVDMSSAHAPKAAKTLAAFCRERKIDVIHAQYPVENVIALLARRRCPGLRVVYTGHLTVDGGAKWRLVNRLFTPGNHAVIAVCNAGRDALIGNGVCPERITVISNGVEPEPDPVRDYSARATLGVGDDEFMISCFARCSPEKGVLFLIDAMARLKALTDRPFRCVICGDGELFDEAGVKIAELGLGERVLMAGYRTDGADILRASDIYVNSSSSEAMSFALLEAMNAALPLVVTDLPGNRELALDDAFPCGLLAAYGDTEGYAQAVLRLMTDSALYDEYAANAPARIRRDFDIDKLAEKVLETYQ